jgi:hypothetical protein
VRWRRNPEIGATKGTICQHLCAATEGAFREQISADVFMYKLITVQLIALTFVKVFIGESHFNPGAQMNDIEW